MSLLGVHTVLVTNAAGGLNPSYKVGDIMLIADHISFPGLGGENPLIGPNLSFLGPRFPPTSDAYDFRLRVLAARAARSIGFPQGVIKEGIYCFVAGPSYETKAEARFLRMVGGDAVGMSTVPEIIVARHCGMKILGLSLITNKVMQRREASALDVADRLDGVTPREPEVEDPLEGHEGETQANHEEVLAASNARALEMQLLVSKIVEMIEGPLK